MPKNGVLLFYINLATIQGILKIVIPNQTQPLNEDFLTQYYNDLNRKDKVIF